MGVRRGDVGRDEMWGEEGAVEGEGEADRERDWGGDEGIMGLGCRWRCREGGELT